MARKHVFTSRTKARKRAADVIFEATMRGMESDPEILRDLLRERKVITAALTPLPEYSIQIIEGVASHLRRIDALLANHINKSGLDRVPPVDLAVMRVAVWEMLDSNDVDAPVAIDQAIAIVKSVSTDSSPNFVNGVLDAVRKKIESSPWERHSVIDGATKADLTDTEDDRQESDSDQNQDSVNESDEVGEINSAKDEVKEALSVHYETNDAPEIATVTDISEPTTEKDSAEIVEKTPSAEAPHFADTIHPSLDDITKSSLEELDELLDDY